MSEPQKAACDLSSTLLGIFLVLLSLQIPNPGDLVRLAVCRLENPWLALSLFYAIPLAESAIFGLLLCRLQIRRYNLGPAIVVGCILGSMLRLYFTWDVYFRFSLFAGGCGTGKYRDLAASAALPYLVGFSIALRQHCHNIRPQPQQ